MDSDRTDSSRGASTRGPAPRLPAHEYFKQHHLDAYIQEALSLILHARPADPLLFLSEFWDGLTAGDHIKGRSFEYATSTPYNLRMFLVAAKKMLSGVAAPQASLSAAGGLTLPEYHALLQFLCPDIPLSALHPAWVAASSIYDADMAARTRSNGGGGAPSSSSSSGCVALPLHAFWESFIVTATYGKFLQALRARCFEPDGWCSCTLDELTQRSAEVVQELLPAGQPVPPPAVLHDVFRKLGGGVDDMGSLNFQAVVDELCGHKQLSLTVAIQVAAAVAMAPSATSTSSMSSQKTLQ